MEAVSGTRASSLNELAIGKLGDATGPSKDESQAEDRAETRLKNEASLHAYSMHVVLVPHVVTAERDEHAVKSVSSARTSRRTEGGD